MLFPEIIVPTKFCFLLKIKGLEKKFLWHKLNKYVLRKEMNEYPHKMFFKVPFLLEREQLTLPKRLSVLHVSIPTEVSRGFLENIYCSFSSDS